MSETENRESVGESTGEPVTPAPNAADAKPAAAPEAAASPAEAPGDAAKAAENRSPDVSEAKPSEPSAAKEPSAPNGDAGDAKPAAAASEGEGSTEASGAPAEGAQAAGAAAVAVAESQAADGGKPGPDGTPTAAGAAAPGKKRKRRRRKKKTGGEASDAAPKKDQAFSRFFEGGAPRQHAFRVGEVVAGRVAKVQDGAVTVDLFGKAIAVADVLEPHEIPEPPAPQPAAEAKEGAPVEAVASETAAAAAEGTTEASAPDGQPSAADAEGATEASAPDGQASEGSTEGPATEGQPTAAAEGATQAPATDGQPAAEVAGTELADPAPAAASTAEASETTQAGEVPAEDSTAAAPDAQSAPATEAAPASDAASTSDASAASDASAGSEPAKIEKPRIEPGPLEPEGPHPEPPTVGAIFRGRVGSVAESGHVAIVNRIIDRPRAKAALRLAHEEKRRVPGVVFGYNRGGFDVLVAGIRCFAPARGMSLGMIDDPETLIGRKLEFTVPKTKGGKSIVVTRRGLLEKEARQAAKDRLEELKVGEVLEGKVTDVRDYGALVDIGGIEGLVHMSEIAWTRGGKPSDHVKVGDDVKVEVLKVQKMSRKDRYGKVSLSIRKCLPDPWKEHEELLSIGKPLKAKVVSLTDFGAFLELAPGIEGLLHISELEGKPAHAKDVLSEGEELDVVIDRKDQGQRRLSLSLLTKADLEAIEKGELDLSSAPRSTKTGTHVTVVIERTEHHGMLVQVKGLIGKRGRGYVPNRELPEQGDRKKRFALGTEHTMKIIGTDRDGRLRLSVTGMERDEERRAVRDYRKEAASKGFGTFGDLLKSKLEK